MIRHWLRLATDRRGNAAVEFALLAPVLFLFMTGIFQFGITLNNYVMLTDAVRAGARQFSIERGATTPLTDAQNRIYASAPNMTQASFTITVSVNGTACTTDAACVTALGSAAGLPATVSASYPCSLQVYKYDFAPTCSLQSQTTERIE